MNNFLSLSASFFELDFGTIEELFTEDLFFAQASLAVKLRGADSVGNEVVLLGFYGELNFAGALRFQNFHLHIAFGDSFGSETFVILLESFVTEAEVRSWACNNLTFGNGDFFWAGIRDISDLFFGTGLVDCVGDGCTKLLLRGFGTVILHFTINKAVTIAFSLAFDNFTNFLGEAFRA